MYLTFSFFTVFLKNRNISSKIKRSKVTDYAALREVPILKRDVIVENHCLISSLLLMCVTFPSFLLRHCSRHRNAMKVGLEKASQ